MSINRLVAELRILSKARDENGWAKVSAGTLERIANELEGEARSVATTAFMLTDLPILTPEQARAQLVFSLTGGPEESS